MYGVFVVLISIVKSIAICTKKLGILYLFTALVTFNRLANKMIVSAQDSHTVNTKGLEEAAQNVSIACASVHV